MLNGRMSPGVIPAAADTSRVDEQVENKLPELTLPAPYRPIEKNVKTAPVPSSNINFKLKSLSYQGNTQYSDRYFDKKFEDYIGKDISIQALWAIANQITDEYRRAGYFLSQAYVPAQEIDTTGAATIAIVEGTIGEIELDDKDLANKLYVKVLFERLHSQRPLKAQAMESIMLQLNDIPGKQFKAVITQVDNPDKYAEGTVKLYLTIKEDNGHGALLLDNHGSRFLGPYQGLVTYERSLLPFQSTRVIGLATLPWDELKYIALDQNWRAYPKWRVGVRGNFPASAPGDTLEQFEIESQSTEIAAYVDYQPIRQRNQNLILTTTLDGRNTDSTLVDEFELTKDRIRSIRLGVNYSLSDRWQGFNQFTATVSQGLGVFGASEKGDLNLSRAEADPLFTKATFGLLRQQGLFSRFVLTGQVQGQISRTPLFSAEEFGYGGQDFGRAYDPSEITGDNGVKGTLQLIYAGLPVGLGVSISPYIGYDIGKAWNKDSVGGQDVAGSSLCLGVQAQHKSGFGVSAGVAWPFIREISNPIYKGDPDRPRVLLQTSYSF